jgi:transcription initiation factor IIE alpha subunit
MDHSWKDAYRAMFKEVLTKKDISQIIRILEKLELKSEFVLNDQGLMYYKGQFVGNAILTFYYLFKSDKNRLRLAKQVNKLRKMLEKNDISLHV